jgi:hypothetical protein
MVPVRAGGDIEVEMADAVEEDIVGTMAIAARVPERLPRRVVGKVEVATVHWAPLAPYHPSLVHPSVAWASCGPAGPSTWVADPGQLEAALQGPPGPHHCQRALSRPTWDLPG